MVEGRYDKAAVARCVDTIILETSGFGIFSDREKLALLRALAKKRGLIFLTDSDGGGTVIRSFLKQRLSGLPIKQAYVPRVSGKERRKKVPGREGILGVEGMDAETIQRALLRAGATREDEAPVFSRALGKADLFRVGLTGRPDSAARRAAFLTALDFPPELTPNALLEVVNALYTPEEFFALFQS